MRHHIWFVVCHIIEAVLKSSHSWYRIDEGDCTHDPLFLLKVCLRVVLCALHVRAKALSIDSEVSIYKRKERIEVQCTETYIVCVEVGNKVFRLWRGEARNIFFASSAWEEGGGSESPGQSSE